MVSQGIIIAAIATILNIYGIQVTNATCGFLGLPLIRLNKWLIHGVVLPADDLTPFCAFTGIRYAEPPLGNLRFRPPVPFTGKGSTRIQQLDNVLKTCPQPGYSLTNSNPTRGTEDCLFVDVYTPNVLRKLPVIVFLHGGAFSSGNGQTIMYGPQRFLRRNVVLVGFNYRLGPLGFLSTGDAASPGNYGLQDQLLVLQWIQNYISLFGGDPNSVTVVGESAGAISANLLLLSPLSTGLFHRLVLESSSALCDEANQPQPLVFATSLARQNGCPIDNTSAMIDCLRFKNYADLFNNTQSLAMQYWPVVDGHVIPKKPMELLAAGNFSKVPVIIGYNKDEGLLFSYIIIPRATLKNFNDSIADVLLSTSNFRIQQYIPDVVEALTNKYLFNVTTESEFQPQFIKILSHLAIMTCTHNGAELLAAAGLPVYSYVMDYQGQYSLGNYYLKLTTGIGHGDELIYLFYFKLLNVLNLQDYTMSKTLVDLWVNFAYTGAPTADNSWPPCSNGQLNYVSINTTLRLLGNTTPYLTQEDVAFWETLEPYKMH